MTTTKTAVLIISTLTALTGPQIDFAAVDLHQVGAGAKGQSQTVAGLVKQRLTCAQAALR